MKSEAYSAGLRRWVNEDYKDTDKSVTNYYIENIYDGRRVHKFQKIMGDAFLFKRRLSNKNIDEIIALHSDLSDFFRPMLRKTGAGNDVNFNSFCSKYLPPQKNTDIRMISIHVFYSPCTKRKQLIGACTM